MKTAAPETPDRPEVPQGAAHTHREIHQQPRLWAEMASRMAKERAALDTFLAPLLAEDRLRIVLTGAGTSAYAGQIVRAALRGTTGRAVEAVATTDITATPLACFEERDRPTLLVSFARSGNSPESIAATEIADQLLDHCSHLVITCNAEGSLAARHQDRTDSYVLLTPPEAEDQSFAMTSSLTCMLLGALHSLGGSHIRGLDGCADSAAALLSGDVPDRIAELTDRAPDRFVYLGSGALQALASESALKLLELTGGAVAALSDSSLGFRHGPKAFLTQRTAAVVYVSNDPYTRQYDLDIFRELSAGLPAGQVVAVAGRPDGLPAEHTWLVDGMADADDATLALPAVLCAQLVALAASLACGMRPDNPFPDGEVNRVVQGVTIHPLPER
ncbi:putative tagatose-6-phosphate ketose/aldose isomerase [Streptomyces longisporoflavus]|uniref:SIS domain-containing protein n=1 Tax=Streptomyces longisporoflavus TaxID=28044 RepID=UPI0019CDAA62|nr:SIS domain-containing protein [Streptomyces longisporoflavus]GGV28366.1 putative tagatose-6-phosphate ketose/aldose isomerase [Streptomyces longisporoflavus]